MYILKLILEFLFWLILYNNILDGTPESDLPSFETSPSSSYQMGSELCDLGSACGDNLINNIQPTSNYTDHLAYGYNLYQPIQQPLGCSLSSNQNYLQQPQQQHQKQDQHPQHGRSNLIVTKFPSVTGNRSGYRPNTMEHDPVDGMILNDILTSTESKAMIYSFDSIELEEKQTFLQPASLEQQANSKLFDIKFANDQHESKSIDRIGLKRKFSG